MAEREGFEPSVRSEEKVGLFDYLRFGRRYHSTSASKDALLEQ